MNSTSATCRRPRPPSSRRMRKWRILVLTENFAGWERGGSWDDFSFQSGHDAHIERMAIVGERQWEELALLFTAKGLRTFSVQYFDPAQVATARAWLVAD